MGRSIPASARMTGRKPPSGPCQRKDRIMPKAHLLLRETRNSVAILTLNRPDKLNALNYALVDAIVAALDALEADDAIRAVILTGAGRAFSAGADICEFSEDVARGVEAAHQRFVRRGQAMTARIEAFSKPIIAAINGLAFGGGCEIVEATHLSVAAADARFAKAEIALGMPPCFGGTQRLPRLIGRKRALRLILSGDSISAAEAAQFGLINEVIPAGQAVVEAALALAARLTGHAPTALASCLHAVTRGLNVPIAEGLAIEAEAFARTVPTAGIRDGIAAFLEGRAKG